MRTPNSMLCNKSFTKSVSGCAHRHERHICGLNGDLISGRAWAIGLRVVPPTSFANVGSFTGVAEIAPFSLVQVAALLSCSSEPLVEFP